MVQPTRLPSPDERRRRNREAMLCVIQDVSVEVMREYGVAGLSLHEVARRVNMRAQSLYKYLPSKSALYDALFLKGARLLRESDRSVWQSTELSWDRIDRWMRSRLDFAREHGPLYELVTGAEVPGFTPSAESVREAAVIGEAGTRAVQELIRAGIIAPHLSARRVMNILLAASRGIVAETLGKEPMFDDPGRFSYLLADSLETFRIAWTTERSKP